MSGVLSLRGRLTAIILVPLLLVAAIVGVWQLNNARQTATEVFDNSLLSAALAVANDVAVSGGDALSDTTRDTLADTSGGLVFYHVYAPDGVIVAGYATPPVGIPQAGDEAATPIFFNASYQGRPVHGVRLQNNTQIDGFTGVFTTTVWQDASVRSAFVSDLLLRSLLAIAGMILSVALIVWFGVRIGLHPLTNLEAAIARRNSDDLAPIQRTVPNEVQGIVATINRLFGQVTKSMTAQSEFISSAAHQLRNPIAGVLSLAEAVESAPSSDEAKQRSRDLLDAARETANLGQKLLLLERAKTLSPISAMETFDLDIAFAKWCEELRQLECGSVKLEFTTQGNLGRVTGDEVMLQEALKNLVDNSLRHGGAALEKITVRAVRINNEIEITVEDDGIGLGESAISLAAERFSTFSSTSRSGLGVSIVDAVAQGHSGKLTLRNGVNGLAAAIHLPIGDTRQ